MICLDCLKSQIVPSCTESLILGTIADFDEDIIIYIRDVTVAKLHRFNEDDLGAQLKSGVAGVVTLPMNTKFIWMQDHYYEMWVTKLSATSIEDMETVTVDDGEGGTEITDCINLRITCAFDQDSTLSDYTTLTLVSSE